MSQGVYDYGLSGQCGGHRPVGRLRVFAELGGRRHETLIFIGFDITQAVDDFAGWKRLQGKSFS